MAKNYLSRGDKGDNIRVYQINLVALGYFLKVDGSFGTETEKITKQFQGDNGLVVDGYAGPATQAKINQLLSKNKSNSNKIIKIAIDAGHGLRTAGKETLGSLGYGVIKEWTLNNKIAVELENMLKRYDNVEVLRLDDRTGRVDITLGERTRKANEWGADITISIHHNAGIKGGKGGGLVLYRYPNSSKFTKKMQKDLYDSIIAQTGLKGNRASPLAEAKFAMVRYTNAAAILIEHGFMDSPSDMKEIMKSDWPIKNAKGIVNWLESEFKLRKKVIKVSTKVATHRVRINGKQIGAFGEIDNIVEAVTSNLDKKLIEVEKI